MSRTTRRQILKTSLRGGLATLAAPGAFATALSQAGEAAGDAGKGLQSVRIGLHCGGWDSRPLGELFGAAHELGYDGVELAPPWQEKKYDMEDVYRMPLAAGTTLAPAQQRNLESLERFAWTFPFWATTDVEPAGHLELFG